MKRILLSLIAVSCFGVFNKAFAQSCNIRDVAIQNLNVIDANGSDGKCTATFDASFTISNTPGSNYIFIQTYIASATRNGQPISEPNPNPFPDYFGCNSSSPKTSPPNGAQIGNPILNIVIDNSGASPILSDDYVLDPANAAIIGVGTGSTIVKDILPNGMFRFTLTDLQIDMPFECSTGTEYTYVSAVFTTATADPLSNVTCLNCAIITPVPSLSVSGGTNCNQVEVDFNNFSSETFTGNYTLYADNDGDGALLSTVDGGQDVSITTGNLNIAAGTTQRITTSLTNAFVGKDVLVAVDLGTGQFVQLLPTIECSVPLPVSLKSFNAKRVNDKATLLWETASESNNRGFSIQRNNGSGWVDVFFVASKADGGNSSSLLLYEYNEINTAKDITQYRLLQVDFDGKSKLSEIRSIRGLSQLSKNMIYPNPSNNGGINIIFDDERGKRDVLISDMGGRIIKQYRDVSAATLRVDQLNPGMYSVRISNQASGSQTNEKLIISRAN